MKYKDWLNEWLAVFARPVSKERALVRIIPALGEYELGELSPLLLQRFITGLSSRYAPNSVNGTTSRLSDVKRREGASKVQPDENSRSACFFWCDYGIIIVRQGNCTKKAMPTGGKSKNSYNIKIHRFSLGEFCTSAKGWTLAQNRGNF